MRKFLLFAAAFCAFTACDEYDDSALWSEVNNQGNKIEFLESELEALKLKVEGLNQTYKAITSMLNGGVITGVTPVTDGGRTGYAITVQTIVDSNTTPVTTATNTYTIWNGVDGADGSNGSNGSDGAPGSTPQITVELEAATGLYYWVVNGQPLTDAAGNKIYASAQNGADGTPGTPGAPGAAGKDGNTPQLKIDRKSASDDTLVWWVSYDNGANWIELGVFDGTVEGSSISVSVVDGKVVISQPGQEPISFDIVEANNIKIAFSGIDAAKGMHMVLGAIYEVGYTVEGASEGAIVKAETLNGKFVVENVPAEKKIKITTGAESAADVILVHVYDGNACTHTSFNAYSDIATVTPVEREVTLPLLYGDAAAFEYTGAIALDMPAAEDIELTITPGQGTLPADRFTVDNVKIAKGATSAVYKVVIDRALESGSYTLPLTVASSSAMGYIWPDKSQVSINVTDTPSKITLGEENYFSPYTRAGSEGTNNPAGYLPLYDNNAATYWTSDYSGLAPAGDPTYGVYIDVTLPQQMVAMQFVYTVRAGNGKVVTMAVGIKNGEEWNQVGTVGSMPQDNGAVFTTDLYHLDQYVPFGAVRFGIPQSNMGDLIEQSSRSAAVAGLDVYGLY
ncbi:MAG: DUF4988 domain-containing protein [Alistipes sp.]|nr:DUF4988 domain-containing protein [Alistipes sp.]